MNRFETVAVYACINVCVNVHQLNTFKNYVSIGKKSLRLEMDAERKNIQYSSRPMSIYYELPKINRFDLRNKLSKKEKTSNISRSPVCVYDHYDSQMWIILQSFW